MSDEALQLAYMVLDLGEVGDEYDLRMPVHGRVYRPATLTWTAEGLLVEEGAEGVPYAESSRTVDALLATPEIRAITTDGQAEWNARRVLALPHRPGRPPSLHARGP